MNRHYSVRTGCCSKNEHHGLGVVSSERLSGLLKSIKDCHDVTWDSLQTISSFQMFGYFCFIYTITDDTQ